MSKPIRGQDGHLVFPIGPKNTNLIEDIEILLPVKFRWIPWSSFRGEVEYVSANQRPGRPSCFSDQPEKHKLGRGCWDLASCQVSLNSVQPFQRSSRKCLSQSEARAVILFFRSAQKKTTNLIEDIEIYFLSSFVEFRAAVSEEKTNMSQPIRGQGGHLVFPIGSKNTNLVEGVEILLLSSFVEFRSAVSEEKSKMSQQIRSQGGHLVFPIGPKNTNLIEGVKILLPVKFRWIPFSSFREEAENAKVYAGRTKDGRTTDGALWQ